ncbi:uncharacterized protein LOC111334423 isoform X2 [Stylophora pistillata]|uniref:uncharacterized protein LOC111334423 isoform X2 n=1 Tax=Stylophora pistillata TaxID=50429 RepID=UPI000C04C898|nr:uncharacterized protein LOC111334423 isoform X2 [Stylophora pistillata]
MSTYEVNKKMTTPKSKVNKENLRRTRGKKIGRNITETPTFLSGGNERRKLLFSGERKGKTPKGSLIAKEMSAGVEHMEQDEALKENCIFVKSENGDSYIALETDELKTTKIFEEVTCKFNLPIKAIKYIELKDGRKSFVVRNNDGTTEKRRLSNGDRLFSLEQKVDEPNTFILVEQDP